MNKKRLLTIVGIVLLAVATFISCTDEVDNNLPRTSISFAPSVSKALNQQGSAVDFSRDVNDYHWKYYCSTVDGTPSEDEWKEFTDAQTGLGTIKDLFKGDSYYFGLRGYTTGTSYTDDNLIWEGFHYGDDGRTPASVKLNAKNQLITVDVYTKGLGYLYFSISAPNESSYLISDTNTGALVEGAQPDRFVYSYESLDQTVSGTDYLTSTSYTTETKYWLYEDAAGTPNKSLPAGTYLFSIKQQTWDPEKPAETSGSNFGAYTDVEERAQILIVNIVSGVDTVIAGSLDSKGMVPFEYYGYSDDDQHGLQLIWHQKSGNVSALTVFVEDADGNNKYIHPYDRIKVADGDFVQIYTSVLDAAELGLYINGEEMSFETDTNGFFMREEDPCYVKPGDKDVVTFESVKAYGKLGTDYMISLTYKGESMSFTIVGSATVASKGTYISGTNIVEFTSSADQHIRISGEMPGDGAKALLEDLTQGYATSETNNKLTLSLSIKEENRTETFALFEIGMSALAEVFEDEELIFSTTTNVTETDSYVIARVEFAKGLKDLSVLHNGDTMIPWTSTSDIHDATEAEDNNRVGFYLYDRFTGILYLKTKTFSPFKVNYTPAEYHTVSYYVPKNDVPVYTERILDGFKTEFYSYIVGDQHAIWMTSFSDTAPEFDFSTPITTDLNLYGKWHSTRYEISYLKHGGYTTDTLVDHYIFGQGVASFPSLTRPAILPDVFDGWYDAEQNGNKITSISKKEYGDKTLHAVFKSPATKVTAHDLFSDGAVVAIWFKSGNDEDYVQFLCSGTDYFCQKVLEKTVTETDFTQRDEYMSLSHAENVEKQNIIFRFALGDVVLDINANLDKFMAYYEDPNAEEFSDGIQELYAVYINNYDIVYDLTRVESFE